MGIDFFLFQQINQFAGTWWLLDNLAIFFAKYFGYILIACLFAFLIKKISKYWPMVVKAITAAVLARFIIVNIIRWLLPRPRPFIENEINLLLSPSALPSFPSGHAAFFFALSYIVYSYNKKAGIFFFISAFLISFSRVFVGLHWPSDIITGALVGIFSAWLILKIFKVIKK